MAKPKTPKTPQALSPGEEAAVTKFAEGTQKLLAQFPRYAEQVQDLLGRWEQLSEQPQGLLGGELVAVINEAVLHEQVGRLAESLGRRHGSPRDLAEHADFVSALIAEFATLLKVLATVELEPGNRLEADWERLSDRMLQKALEMQGLTEQMEAELERGEENEGEEPQGAGQFVGVSPGLLRQVWQKTQAGEPLEPEQANLANVLREHPQYAAAWEPGAPQMGVDSTINGVNPFLHATLHTIVERQLAGGDPPETRAALDRLVAAGVSRHEAVHRIGNVMVRHLYEMGREDRRFDHRAYVKALNELK